ncbi:hypothetical protein NSK_002040 [Nannochloropsis salina CCMP1776]|uniref:Uncharacterized protein n=1 Tax=Nannochloropsis salina CCMP1776 TaxID=1027361 RepID=A0A4D9DA90_9STRA|nr:hypothetical protein NSK_002040 [Nannochloropsis salina CCMP1776]|eukprot:TFJ86953.1 hypothetical protein NSK_002040 [Nannochloropsis salina CCMP1776]
MASSVRLLPSALKARHAALFALGIGGAAGAIRYQTDEGTRRSVYFWSRAFPIYLHYRYPFFGAPLRLSLPPAHLPPPLPPPLSARTDLFAFPARPFQVKSQVQHLPEAEQEEAYAPLHQKYAPEAVDIILHLKGFYIKVPIKMGRRK